VSGLCADAAAAAQITMRFVKARDKADRDYGELQARPPGPGVLCGGVGGAPVFCVNRGGSGARMCCMIWAQGAPSQKPENRSQTNVLAQLAAGGRVGRWLSDMGACPLDRRAARWHRLVGRGSAPCPAPKRCPPLLTPLD
jgi:hypothetical protein